VLGIAHGRAGFAHLCESDSPRVVGAAAGRPGLIEDMREGAEYVRVDGARDVGAGVDVVGWHPFFLDLAWRPWHLTHVRGCAYVRVRSIWPYSTCRPFGSLKTCQVRLRLTEMP
jgi:hypothetical protein